MEDRYIHLKNAVKNLLIVYPEIKGTFYSIYFSKPPYKTRNVFLNLARDFFSSKVKIPEVKKKVWYLLHGELPSYYLNLEAVIGKLKDLKIEGNIVCYKSEYLKRKKTLWKGIEIKRPSVYFNKLELLRIFKESKKIAIDMDNALKEYSRKNNIKFPDLKFLKASLYMALKFDNLAKFLICNLKPKIVIIGANCGYFHVPFIRYGNLINSTTISIQHGDISSYEEIEDCKYFLCWGDYFKEKIIKSGIKGDNLISIGSPRMDDIFEKFNSLNEKELKLKFGFSPNDKIILHISDGNFGKDFSADYPDELLRIQKESFPVVLKKLSENYKIAIKLHPYEEKKYWEKLENENIKIFDNSFSIYELVKISDVTSTIASVAGFEAMVLGKPNIYFSPEGIDLVDYPEIGMGFKVKSSEEWISLVKKLLKDNDFYRKTTEDIVVKRDKFISNLGNSSKKIAEFIYNKLNNE